MKAPYLQFDTLDDRKELYVLLGKLSPRHRVAFLDWMGHVAFNKYGGSIRHAPSRETRERAELAERDSSADERLVLETAIDVWMLASQWQMDLDYVLKS